MKSFENAFILSLREIYMASKLKASDLESIVGTITEQELQYLNYWETLWKSAEVETICNQYSEYSDSELKGLFELKTGYSFPIPMTFLGSKTKQQLISYYILKGYNVIYPKKIFTEEQKILLDHNIKGIVVTNCGPGVGKTTTANQRAYELRSEGVLLISYTNEAINHNYSTLHEYPATKGVMGKKDYEKKLNVTTADSLAGRILGGVNIDSHDINIRAAIEKIQNNEDIYSMFCIPGQGSFYKHIIVDECQDIDDIRGELLVTFFLKLKCKSLCLFGDPRQRIREGCGLWYTQLWEGTYNLPHVEDSVNPKITKVGFTYSHRFKNVELINLANNLSQRRANIHYELVPHPNLQLIESSKPIEFIGLEYDYEDQQLEAVALYIRDILHKQYNVPYNEIAVVGPSLGKDNKTSILAGKICTVFKHNKIPCYSKIEGSYKPTGVYFTTIQSIKGKEFDYVFIFGMSNYPNTFSMIPYQEAESLIYVAHTRARKKIIYLAVHNNFELPRGIAPNYLTHVPPSNKTRNKEEEPEINIFKVSELSVDFGLQKLLQTNGFTLETEKQPSLINTLFPPPKGIDVRFWGIMSSMGVQMQLIDQYLPTIINFAKGLYKIISKKDYESLKRKGVIINGKNIITKDLMVCQDGINVPRPEEIEELKNIILISPSNITFKQRILLTQIYDFILGDNMSSRYDIDNNINLDVNHLYKEIAIELINKYGSPSLVEVNVTNFNLVGSIDAVIGTSGLEFKTVKRNLQNTDFLQIWLYCLISSDKIKPTVINLQTGDIISVKSNQSIERWKYIINAYVQIRTHSELVQYRLTKAIENNLSIPKTYPNNTYVVDSEFGKNDTIFDLAVVNINDIYRSIVQTINIPNDHLDFATSWIKQPKELFTSSLKLVEVQDLFYHLQRIHGSCPVTLQNYMCKVDISWWPNCNHVDLGPLCRQLALKKGTFISGTAPPKLTDIYGQICRPLEFQPHLTPHTALSDALMLYEILILGLV